MTKYILVALACDCSKHRKAEKSWRFSRHRHTVVGMITILSALVSLLSFRVRSRISLELELVALQYQVAVLRRQRKGRLRLFFTDRLLWVWLYRAWPQVLHAHGAGQTGNPWSSGIAKASGSTGGGDHAVWGDPRWAPRSVI